MNQNQYNHYCETHGLPTFNDKLVAAGVVPAATEPSIFELEHALVELNAQLLTKIFAENKTDEARKAAMIKAIPTAAYEAGQADAGEIVTMLEAAQKEDTERKLAYISRGMGEEPADEMGGEVDMNTLPGLFNQNTKAQPRKVRPSRAGQAYPVMADDPALRGLVPDAYTCKH